MRINTSSSSRGRAYRHVWYFMSYLARGPLVLHKLDNCNHTENKQIHPGIKKYTVRAGAPQSRLTVRSRSRRRRVGVPGSGSEVCEVRSGRAERAQHAHIMRYSPP